MVKKVIECFDYNFPSLDTPITRDQSYRNNIETKFLVELPLLHAEEIDGFE